MMYTQYYEEYIKKCLEELKATKNSSIQRSLKKIQHNFKEEDFDNVLLPFVITLAKDIVPHLAEEEIEDALEFEIQEFINVANQARKSFIIKATLRGQENNIYRTIEIPVGIPLSQLCYIILSVFQCDGSHLFSIEVGRETYYCDAFEEQDLFASDYFLSELRLRKGSHMLLTYDFGDNYEFDIVIEESKYYHHFFKAEDIQVIDGKGYGIWEDAHYELDLFYDDRESFNHFIEDNGYESEWYPIDEEFDKDAMNEEMVDDMMLFMAIYEHPELLEEDDDENE